MSKDILQERLAKLREWRYKEKWIDKHDASYSKGYDRAIDEEIKFLVELLK